MATKALTTTASPLAQLPKQLHEARLSHRALVAANPNYFGNLKASTFKAVLGVVENTWYEQLTCVGYSPNRDQLNATVQINRAAGYGGGLCDTGSHEYVRFFVDYGFGWQDVGVAGFEVHDIPDGKDCAGAPEKPLSYSVGIKLGGLGDCCFEPALPRVRAILSWDVIPPADPNFTPAWGNRLDAAVQLKPHNSLWCLLKGVEPGTLAKFQIAPELLETTVKPIPLPEPEPLGVSELAKLYQGKASKFAVEPHRFGLPELHGSLASPFAGETIEAKISDWKSVGIDWSKALAELVKTSGDVGYEELDCLAFDSEREWLVATFSIKRPVGYSGDLCSNGSTEYVAFWADWDDTCEWRYLDTVPVSVHDIASIPAGGLHYTALLRTPVDAYRRDCAQTRPARVRAVLSWATPPSTTDADAVPYWGNRLETHVVIKPGEPVVNPGPTIRSLGSIPVSKIDVTSGLTTFDAVFESTILAPDAYGRPCPFGGRVAVKGMAFPGWFYRLQVKRVADPLASWTPLKVSLRYEDNAGNLSLPVPPLNTDGFFAFVDAASNTEDVLGEWDTTGDELWEVMIELASQPDTAHIVGVLSRRLQLDNTGPEVDVSIDSGGDCKDFDQGVTLNGHFVARDAYFGSFGLGTLPFGAPAGQLTPGSGTVQTAPAPGNAWQLNTTGMTPCGYVLVVTAADRAIINSGSVGHYASKAVGFCVRTLGQ